jgi:signal transduction histidine kinase
MPDRDRTLEDRLEQMVDGSTELAFELSLGGVLQRVAELAAELTDARYSAIGLLAPDGRTLETFVTHGIPAEERARMGHLPQGHGVLGVVIRKGEVLRLPDLHKHPDSIGFPPNHPPMRSFLGVPVVGRRGVLGDLYVTEKAGGLRIPAEPHHHPRAGGGPPAAAVENARLHEESARLLEEVQQLHRSRERFFAMVNHELRNALAATFGWAEMLVRKKDPATVPRAAFEVMDSAEQAIALINDLLDLSRLDEDRLKPVFMDVSGELVSRQALSRVTPAADMKSITLALSATENLPSCHTDARRVEQILLNLLTNAIRHSPAGAEVSLAVSHEGGNLAYTVRDEGPGVAADEVERIFDVYVTKAGEERQGTGLGLPLSRRLAQLLGGELFAVSHEGSGGEFVLLLPVAAAPP